MIEKTVEVLNDAIMNDAMMNGGMVEGKETAEPAIEERPRTWEPVHFLETRMYLQKVRDQKRRIGLLEERIRYRKDAGLSTDYLEEELSEQKDDLTVMVAEVAEEISKLKDVNQESVFFKRYIDTLSWEEVAAALDFKMRTVQRCHGSGLPRMEQILLADGLIKMDVNECESIG